MTVDEYNTHGWHKDMTFEEVDGNLSELILTSTGEIVDVWFNLTVSGIDFLLLRTVRYFWDEMLKIKDEVLLM